MNSKKLHIILLGILLLLAPVYTSAQLFDAGIILGISGNQIDGDTQKGYHKIGITSGISLKTSLNSRTNFIIELQYANKGAVSNIKLNDNTNYQEFKSSLHYLELPLLIELASDKKLSYSAGISPSYLIKAKLYSFDNEISEDLYKMKKYNANFVFQTSYKLKNKISLNLSFEYSLLTIRNDDYWMNNSISIGFNYFITQK